MKTGAETRGRGRWRMQRGPLLILFHFTHIFRGIWQEEVLILEGNVKDLAEVRFQKRTFEQVKARFSDMIDKIRVRILTDNLTTFCMRERRLKAG